jgi:hypothetical protein
MLRVPPLVQRRLSGEQLRLGAARETECYS